MLTIYGNPSADGKYFGLYTIATNGVGTVIDTSDPANIPAHGLLYSGVFPRDVIISSAAVYAEDPVADSINFVLRVDGVDTAVVVNLASGNVYARKTRLSFSRVLNLIIPAGKLFAVRTDFVGAPTGSEFLFVMETYFV